MVDYGPLDPDLKVKDKTIERQTTGDDITPYGVIILHYKFTDGSPSCTTKWVKCIDPDTNNTVFTININGTTGDIRFSGIKLDKKYKFKLYLKNSIASNEKEITDSVGIPTVKIYQTTDNKWHNAIVYVYQTRDHKWHKAVPFIYQSRDHKWHRTLNAEESRKLNGGAN